MEARAFGQAARLFEYVARSGASSRILVARAVVEKNGTDLRTAAEVATKARAVSEKERAGIRALALDQSGIIARRRGLHRLAFRFYDQAFTSARPSNCPERLIVQIRSHRDVALERQSPCGSVA